MFLDFSSPIGGSAIELVTEDTYLRRVNAVLTYWTWVSKWGRTRRSGGERRSKEHRGASVAHDKAHDKARERARV